MEHIVKLDTMEISLTNPSHDYSINRPPNEKFILPFDFAWPRLVGDAELVLFQLMIDLRNASLMQKTNRSV